MEYVPFLRARIFIGRLVVWTFVFVIFFGLISILFFSHFDFHFGYLGTFPKLNNFKGPVDSNFYTSSNILWVNLFAFSILYFFVYSIAVPCWVFAAVSRHDWTDLRLRWQTFTFILFVVLIASIEIYEYIFGDVLLIGYRPRLDMVSSLFAYTVSQIVALMGIANFLLFTATLITSAKIFGRPEGN